MVEMPSLDNVAISPSSDRILRKILSEHDRLRRILRGSTDETEVERELRGWAFEVLDATPVGRAYYDGTKSGRGAFEALRWQDVAAIRLLDYIDNEGRSFVDLNLRGMRIYSRPIRQLWLAAKSGTGGATTPFFEDMYHLFRQLTGKDKRRLPDRTQVLEWMERHPSGLDEKVVRLRDENKKRILRLIVRKIDERGPSTSKYRFDEGMSDDDKMRAANAWWEEHQFHLKFAIRDPDELNAMLDFSLTPETMQLLHEARDAGIPFFVNPYYLSLLHVNGADLPIGSDQAIRDYVLYSKELVEEFGHIVAWEKEDIVKPGEPNAAGWLLPEGHNVHRRYPEVAILIPDTMGRACGGLCTSCQRMYDFQSGHLNFNLDKLRPRETWSQKLERLMSYWRNDAQLRDILITGGDALMSTEASLEKILDAVYEMAVAKRADNAKRADGAKYAEMLRVRLGTRLPVYLPQRVTPELVAVLRRFKDKAQQVGIKQFVIQTHFETAMEVTPVTKLAIERLLSAGWTVTNQLVFTAASSRRGHSAKLRKVLNDLGVISYYAFTVKGFRENSHNFSTNARAVQEQREEKSIGELPEDVWEEIRGMPERAERMLEQIDSVRRRVDIPFMATDRNVLNLPGVGKSLTFRVIGLTRFGRRILLFDHDVTRKHSPMIEKMGKVPVIESKSISDYLTQLVNMGEDISEYESIWGYSLGETEPRMPVYEYPDYDFKVTEELTNLDVG